jgi:hypothetical protein
MPLDPINDKFEVYDKNTKRQRLVDVSDVVAGTAAPPIPLYDGTVAGAIPITETGTPVVLTLSPPFPPRSLAALTTEPPGRYNLIFSLTATITHTVADPNDRYGGKIFAVVKVNTTEVARSHAAVVFSGEEFSVLVTKTVQLADGDEVSVELVGDVDADVTPDQCYLQAVYLSA